MKNKNTSKWKRLLWTAALMAPLWLSAQTSHHAAPGTLQATMDAAADGDIILLEPGTYSEDLNFPVEPVSPSKIRKQTTPRCCLPEKSASTTKPTEPVSTSRTSPLTPPAITFSTAHRATSTPLRWRACAFLVYVAALFAPIKAPPSSEPSVSTTV